MNKFKKLVATAVAAVCTFAFATTAFAATPTQRTKLADAISAYGVSNANDMIEYIPDSVIDYIVENKGAVQNLVNSTQKDIAANPMETSKILTEAAKQIPGLSDIVSVDSFGVDRDNGKVQIAVTVGNVSATVAPSINQHGNGNTSSSESKANAVPQDQKVAAAVSASPVASTALTASSTAVIKATGDNSSAVIIASILAVAAVLGLAVRKNTQLNVA